MSSATSAKLPLASAASELMSCQVAKLKTRIATLRLCDSATLQLHQHPVLSGIAHENTNFTPATV
jgi:hypothetical protein